MDLLAQVHDSILLQIPTWAIVDVAFPNAQQQVFEYVSPGLCYNNRSFKIATDMKLGLNWGGFHPEMNPLGMREVKSLEELPATLKELNIV